MELNINISQKLTLSQRMLLSARILQMSSLELNEYLKELSESNPVIEYTEKQSESDKYDTLRKKLEWLDSADEQNRYYYKEDRDDEADNDNWNFRINDSETLEAHLLSQINTQRLSKPVKKAAEFAAKSLDKNGFLKESSKSIAEFCSVSTTDADKAIALIKTLDPSGVGAFDLRECLLIQLLSEEKPDKTAISIVSEHLELLAKNQLKTISKLINASMENTLKAVQKVKTLNPRPCSGFATKESLNYIVPDAYIFKNDKDKYEINLSDYYSPSIKINNYYKDIIKYSNDSSAKEYVTTKLNQAEWVVNCISKRNSTFLSTLKLIVTIQISFFENGPGNLVPMKLSDISNKLSVHDSTISRAVRDKYIQCKHGVFPVSYFFTSAVSSVSADSDEKSTAVSQDSAKQKIKEIIDNENKQKPLSDRSICELLEKDGIAISRRTVAKYRESMGIGGASVRKDY